MGGGFNDTLTETEGKSRYDAAARQLLSDRAVLSRILKACVPEYAGCTYEEIGRLIEDEPEVGTTPVHRFAPVKKAENIRGSNTEDATDKEGTVRFDIRFNAALPDRSGAVGLVINVEVQNKYHPGYSLVRRGLYYCARLLSAQYKSEFSDNDYNKLKKVYSIWICPQSPSERADTVTAYHVTEECVKGHSTEKRNEYDMLNVTVIGFNDDDDADGINGFLKTLLSNMYSKEKKRELLTNTYGMKIDRKIETEVDRMCNLSEGIWESGRNEGITEGIALGRNEGIALGQAGMVRNMLKSGMSAARIAEVSGLSEEEVGKLAADTE